MNHKWPVLTAEQTGRGKRRALAAPGARRCSEPGTLSWRPAPQRAQTGHPPREASPPRLLSTFLFIDSNKG